MKKTSFLIFSDYNFRAIIVICRLFSKYNVNFFIIAKSKTDLVFLTKYKKNVIFTRKSDSLSAKEIITIRKKINFDNVVILPTSEFLNQFLLKNNLILLKNKILVPLVNKSLYLKVSNKKSFANYLKKNDILIPKEFKKLFKLDYPFVAKPIVNIKKETKYPYLIFNNQEKANFLLKEDQRDFFYQEYINGQSYYLLYYISKNGIIFKSSQKNLAQQYNGKSIIFAKKSNLHFKTISYKFERILKDLKFHGLIMIEVKQIKNKFFFIEANPRLWGPMNLIAETQDEILTKFIEDNINIKIKNNKTEKTTYLWLGGFIENIKNNKEITWYIKKPRYLIVFLLKHFFYDVYFKLDTIRVFMKELGI
ncbi:MAG: ATP-grasp domain-containing protein [Patescibacteria group bacterium]